MTGGRRGPLHGLRVLDLTSVIMGPWATQMLARYGADVVKIEPPEGDIIRQAGTGRHPLMGPVFMQQSRGKRSVVLDLKVEAGRAAMLRLVRNADVVIHNVRRAAMQRLHLTYADVSGFNDRLIYVSLVGYAHEGPYAERAAYDDLIQGLSGLASLFVSSGEDEPRYVPMLLADRVTGMNAVVALLAALLQRVTTGRGCQIEVAMFETMAELVLADHFGGQMFDPPTGPFGYGRALAPNRKPFRTSDGHVCVLVYNEAQWVRFFDAVGERQRFRSDPKLCDPATRAQHYDEAYGVLAEILASNTTSHWLEVLGAADVPIVPMHDLTALLEDGHLRKTGFFGWQNHPSEGLVRTLGSAVQLDAVPWADLSPAPRLGQHSEEVLRAAGYDDRELAALVAAGATSVPAV